jgi:hypothetical protein
LSLREEHKFGGSVVLRRVFRLWESKNGGLAVGSYQGRSAVIIRLRFQQSRESQKKYVGLCLLLGQPEVRGRDRERCLYNGAARS